MTWAATAPPTLLSSPSSSETRVSETSCNPCTDVEVCAPDLVENRRLVLMNLAILRICFLHSFSVVFLYWFYVFS
ncbi:hypothetical protein C4D60_Mb08t22600 [Musa balbisiana]|uniref:Uncharacterized protein n=1 Tax=Musa balbisiana TaxID=52838 RepID=A0A4S8K5U1_MUSBA|nr:hypothetical protein C4D60_Mb08t22600 [Musa balbisiana]